MTLGKDPIGRFAIGQISEIASAVANGAIITVQGSVIAGTGVGGAQVGGQIATVTAALIDGTASGGAISFDGLANGDVVVASVSVIAGVATGQIVVPVAQRVAGVGPSYRKGYGAVAQGVVLERRIRLVAGTAIGRVVEIASPPVVPQIEQAPVWFRAMVRIDGRAPNAFIRVSASLIAGNANGGVIIAKKKDWIAYDNELLAMLA